MATLRITYDELKREFARFLSIDTNSDNWASDETDVFNDSLKAAQRRFYFPESGHVWSFLAPTVDFALTAETGTYSLPSDFIRMLGEFTFKPGDSLSKNVESKKLGFIDPQQMRSVSNATPPSGPPRYYTIRPIENTGRSFNGTDAQYQLILHPTPDKAYNLQYRSLRS